MKNLFKKFKKIAFFLAVSAMITVAFLLFSNTALGERIDFKDLPAAIKEAIMPSYCLLVIDKIVPKM